MPLRACRVAAVVVQDHGLPQRIAPSAGPSLPADRAVGSRQCVQRLWRPRNGGGSLSQEILYPSSHLLLELVWRKGRKRASTPPSA